MAAVVNGAYMTHGNDYNPNKYSFSNTSSWISTNVENCSCMKTNREIRGCFVSQLEQKSTVYFQWWEGHNIGTYDENNQTDYYYYFLTQDNFDDVQIECVGVGAGWSYPTRCFPVSSDPIVFLEEEWQLFYIPEGHFGNAFDGLAFRGFTKDVIYIGMVDTNQATWADFYGTYIDEIKGNDWKSYYSFRDMQGRTPEEIASSAYQEGYNVGVSNNVANEENGVWKLVSNASNAVSSVLKTELMPNITLGGMLAIPLMGLVLFFLLKMIKGNS